MSALATVAGKVLSENFLQKMIFDRVFCVTIADANIGSLKSLHTLLCKYLEHILVNFEQNRIVRPNYTKF